MISIAVSDLVKRYASRPILNGVTLALGRGERIGVVGPSGCGKTTFLRLVAGLDVPDGGTIHLDGKLASTAGRVLIAPERRSCGMVFQDLGLWNHLRVRQHLLLPLRAQGVPRRERRQRVDAWLERVQLHERSGAYPAELSGGERQRLALARALCTQPGLVLLDEPLSHLDAPLHAAMLDLLRETLATTRATVIHVSHDPDELAALDHRVIDHLVPGTRC